MYDIAVMHDFFVDRIVFDECNLIRKIVQKRKKGGGSIRKIRQVEKVGGNAVNLARYASLLGTNVLLITHSDDDHRTMLINALKRVRKIIIKDLAPGFTVSIERGENVMISDVGGAGNFSPELISKDDWEEIKKARMLCILNWSSNRFGTELLLEARKNFPGTIFFDPADFRERIKDYCRLIKIASRKRVIDWISLNEFEALATSRLIGVRSNELSEICVEIARALSARVDVHTSYSSFTYFKELSVNRHRVKKEVIRTGAGDMWNACSIFSFLNGLKDYERIWLSDLVCSHYVSTGREEESISLASSRMSTLMR